MLKQIKMSESVGRTIIRFGPLQTYKHCPVAVVFDDGTFAVLTIDRGYASGDEEIEDYFDFERALVDGDYQDTALALGIISRDDVAKLRRERNEKRKASDAAAERARRQQYERLKLEFEGGK